VSRHSARAAPVLRRLVEDDPGLAALSLWCAHRDAELTGTAETAGDTIRYGAAFVRLPPHEAAGVAAHHVLHVALRHGGRMAAMAERTGAAFDPGLWNAAADAIVNEALMLAGYALPRPALRLTGLLSAALGEVRAPREALAEWDVERLYLRLRAGGGEAARARDHAAAQAHAPDLSPGEVPAAGPAGREDADWRQHLARAMQAGRLAGRGIGTLGGVLADLPQPRIPWEVVLRGRLARALLPLPAPAPLRPSRVFLARDDAARREGGPEPGFEPGRARNAPAPRVVLALDTSSSVGPDAMALFLAEVEGARRRFGAEVHLIPFDEAPEAPRRLDARVAAGMVRTRRGGGTAIAPALAAAARLRPSLVVVLTDLGGDPGPDPGVPVLWAVACDGGAQTPAFGQMLDLTR
jgi:hypothetical protein